GGPDRASFNRRGGVGESGRRARDESAIVAARRDADHATHIVRTTAGARTNAAGEPRVARVGECRRRTIHERHRGENRRPAAWIHQHWRITAEQIDIHASPRFVTERLDTQSGCRDTPRSIWRRGRGRASSGYDQVWLFCP